MTIYQVLQPCTIRIRQSTGKYRLNFFDPSVYATEPILLNQTNLHPDDIAILVEQGLINIYQGLG